MKFNSLRGSKVGFLLIVLEKLLTFNSLQGSKLGFLLISLEKLMTFNSLQGSKLGFLLIALDRLVIQLIDSEALSKLGFYFDILKLHCT